MGIKKLLPEIKENVSLANYTTFRIGGKAKYFFIAKNKEDIILTVKLAKKLKLPFFILGAGSKLLIADKGFKGLVIKTENTKYQILNTKIIAGAGTRLGELISGSVKSGLSGLEWASGIPGTVGGAIRGNAGAFKKSIKEIVKEVEVFDTKTEKTKILKNKDCNFYYRESIFKKNKNLIILSTLLQLKKRKKSEIKRKIKEYISYRKNMQPLNFPSAGSIFKNPKGFFAGQLIEECGLKGKKIGKVKISEKHSNFIINLGKGKARDVKKLINLVKKKVKNKFGIKLEEEIQYLGF